MRVFLGETHSNPHQYCLCVSCISREHSTATGPGACNCWSGDTASSSRLPWRRWGECSRLQRRTTHLPWSCTSCQEKKNAGGHPEKWGREQVRTLTHVGPPAGPIKAGTSCDRAFGGPWIKQGRNRFSWKQKKKKKKSTTYCSQSWAGCRSSPFTQRENDFFWFASLFSFS